MPELPEVETTRRGILPHLLGRRIQSLVVRESRLRWPIPADLSTHVEGHTVLAVNRRGKYLLLETDSGSMLLHLGMSGSLRLVDATQPPARHDHVDIVLDDGHCLRLRDPRRFGALLWAGQHPQRHPLLAELGPEPLEDDFNAAYLHQVCQGRRVAIKNLLMNAHVVVGVGNIYANEALYLAGIHPNRAAGRLSYRRCGKLVETVKQVLNDALEQGGTTLRDFLQSDGSPGYFQLRLNVYGREGQECRSCGQALRSVRLGQRSTFYCPRCQR